MFGCDPTIMGLKFLVEEAVESPLVAIPWGDYRWAEAGGADAGRDRREGRNAGCRGTKGRARAEARPGRRLAKQLQPPIMRTKAAQAACGLGGNALPARRWCRCPWQRQWIVRTRLSTQPAGGLASDNSRDAATHGRYSMAWLFFIDESGHDHKNMPYEVRGGFAIHVGQLWSFAQDVQGLEVHCFGCRLHDHGKEIKGSTLVDRNASDLPGRVKLFRMRAGKRSAAPSSPRAVEASLQAGSSSRPMAKPVCTWPGKCSAFLNDIERS